MRPMTRNNIEQHLRKMFPYGHQDFISKIIDLAALHSKKNFKYAYGGEPFGNFKREAVIMSLYPQIKWNTYLGVCLSNMLKQLDATLWEYNSGHSDKAIESMDKCLEDVSVYAVIAQIMVKEMNKDDSSNSTDSA